MGLKLGIVKNMCGSVRFLTTLSLYTDELGTSSQKIGTIRKISLLTSQILRSVALIQITSIEKRFDFWHVDYENDGVIGSWIYNDVYEVFRLLIDSGFYMDKISYEFPDQPEGFTENVTIVGNAKEWPVRGYRNPSLIDEYEVDIETAMKDIETIYRGRSFEKLERDSQADSL